MTRRKPQDPDDLQLIIINIQRELNMQMAAEMAARHRAQVLSQILAHAESIRDAALARAARKRPIRPVTTPER